MDMLSEQLGWEMQMKDTVRNEEGGGGEKKQECRVFVFCGRKGTEGGGGVGFSVSLKESGGREIMPAREQTAEP